MNFKESVGKKDVVLAIVILVGTIAFFNRASCSSGPVPAAKQSSTSTASNINWSSPEVEKPFKSSCKNIVYDEREKGVYYKEFLKSPNKFIGERLSFKAKIMHIEESGNRTMIQAYITKNMDSVIMDFHGVMKIYEGDIIQVWGEGAGVIEGENRMGVSMSWPRILARYIQKIRSDD